ncbi:hypothetical protein [Pinirhizobacter sp.]|uniref:hypothetical protein n=1 Tax=Pinirhizobacter sp. TaxID=2950432 RepID=UPI002F41B174
MNLGSLLPNAALQWDVLGHQCQIKAFEENLKPQSNANKSFLSNLFTVSQGAVASMASAAARNPASTLVFALLASPLAGANAKPFSTTTKEIATAFDGCWGRHRHDDFSLAYSKVRCLGEMASDICSDREFGTSSRYNFGAGQDKFFDTEHDICIKLLGRSAGVNTVLPSRYKELADIFEDVIKDVTANLDDRENIDFFDAEEIIERYELLGEVDDSIMDSRDVSEWVFRHQSELEHKGYVHPPTRAEFIHAADNRYKESGDIKDFQTYKRVRAGIMELDLKPYENGYYGKLISAISAKLGV